MESLLGLSLLLSRTSSSRFLVSRVLDFARCRSLTLFLQWFTICVKERSRSMSLRTRTSPFHFRGSRLRRSESLIKLSFLRRIIDTLLRNIISTGALTTLLAIVNAGVFTAIPEKGFYVPLNIILLNLYFNSLLVTRKFLNHIQMHTRAFLASRRCLFADRAFFHRSQFPRLDLGKSDVSTSTDRKSRR